LKPPIRLVDRERSSQPSQFLIKGHSSIGRAARAASSRWSRRWRRPIEKTGFKFYCSIKI
jgi:hypothetical protein